MKGPLDFEFFNQLARVSAMRHTTINEKKNCNTVFTLIFIAFSIIITCN